MPAAPLQWGRDHVIAELNSRRAFATAPRWLQWGRDHVIAEFKTRELGHPGQGGFNGAAIT